MSGVTAAQTSTTGVPLVVRRHVDFKRVCTCCCLP
ncbi:Ms4527A family Cys-rich leader peptide [Mycolicibacterium hodleri]